MEASLRDVVSSALRSGDFGMATAKMSEAKKSVMLGGPGGQEVMELGALVSVHTQDSVSFQRYVSQLKPYYAADPEAAARSELRPTILGLYLLYLVVENKLSEFHSEIELLSEADMGSREVAFAVGLEQNLMVGTYDEVLKAKEDMPSPEHFSFFISRLLDTVRETIAECAQLSYASLSIEAARDMMMFDTTEDLTAFLSKSRAAHSGLVEWRISDDRIFFDEKAAGEQREKIPSLTLLEENLAYASELERIV